MKTENTNVKLLIIVPVYNEEKNILPFLNLLQKALQNLKISYEEIFCLDPSLICLKKLLKN